MFAQEKLSRLFGKDECLKWKAHERGKGGTPLAPAPDRRTAGFWAPPKIELRGNGQGIIEK
jgi:hypothetical protein